MKTTTPRARPRHRNIYYWAYPHNPLKNDLLPPTRRAQGRCRSDGYYWHQDIAAAGIYWVTKTIASLPEEQRFPFSELCQSRETKAYFLFHLARNLTQVFDDYAALIRTAVRFRETREFLERIRRDGSPNALPMIQDFVSAEAAKIGFKQGTYYRRLDLQQSWLSPEDFALFGLPSKQAELVSAGTTDRASRARKALLQHFTKQWAFARLEALHFSRSYRASRPLRFGFYEDHLTSVLPGAIPQIEPSLSARSGTLMTLRPDWGRRYVDTLQTKFGACGGAWDRVVYRQVEPVLRHEVFSILKKTGKRSRALTGKAYLVWENDWGRYLGVEGLNPACLLAAVCNQDSDTIGFLHTLGILGKSRSANTVDALEEAKALASKGKRLVHTFTEKHLPLQICKTGSILK